MCSQHKFVLKSGTSRAFSDNEAGRLLEFLGNGWRGNEATCWRLSSDIWSAFAVVAATAMKEARVGKCESPLNVTQDRLENGRNKGHLSSLSPTSISFEYTG